MQYEYSNTKKLIYRTTEKKARKEEQYKKTYVEFGNKYL
jgi:hypothetical protein